MVTPATNGISNAGANAAALEAMPNDDGHAVALARLNSLELALATANDVSSLKGLAAQANAVQKLLHDLQAALEQQNQLAEYRIRVSRKIGLVLSQQVHPERAGFSGGRGRSVPFCERA